MRREGLLKVSDCPGEVAPRFEDVCVAAMSATQPACGSGNRVESVEGVSKFPVRCDVIAARGCDRAEPDVCVGGRGTLSDSECQVQGFARQASSLITVGLGAGRLADTQQDRGLVSLDTSLFE